MFRPSNHACRLFNHAEPLAQASPALRKPLSQPPTLRKWLSQRRPTGAEPPPLTTVTLRS
ncbi:hypothetical protein DMC63_00745 [Streptomyces sp. WAC 05977]|nr:hypothetical protein DMC63_00745 [Streptomyces sp. WAC 05977]